MSKGSEMTQRQLHHQSLPQQLLKAGKLTCIHNLQAAQQLGDFVTETTQVVWVSSRHLNWSLLLLGSSACLLPLDSLAGLFLLGGSSWASSKPSLTESVSQQSLLLIYAWEMSGLMNLVSFRDFLKPLSYLLPEFIKILPCRMEYFTSF